MPPPASSSATATAALTIFREFDVNGDGRLDKSELAAFISRVNPGVKLTADQMDVVLEELFTEYAAYTDAGGLRRDGLLAAYADGLGDAVADVATLGLSPDRAAARAAAADLASVAALAADAAPPPSPALAAAYAVASSPAPGVAEPARAQRRYAGRQKSPQRRRVPRLVEAPPGERAVAAAVPADSDLVAAPFHGDHLEVTPVRPTGARPPAPLPPPTTGGWSRAAVHGDSPSPSDASSPPPPPQPPLFTTPASRPPPTTPGSLRRPRSAADPYATPPPPRRSPPSDPDACVATLLARGDADAAAGRLADAARSYGSATKLARAAAQDAGDGGAPPPSVTPLTARALLRLGNTLYGMGQPAAAEAAFVEGLAVLGDDGHGSAVSSVAVLAPPEAARLLPKLRLNLGIAIEAQGRLDDAVAAYERAVAAAPACAAAHKLRGSALFALGHAASAAASLSRALELDPHYADAHVDLGCALCALGDAPGAAAAFSAALRVDGGHVAALYNLASLRRQTGDWAGAVSGYDRVLAVDPGHWRAHLGRGVALTGARRDDAARRAFATALALAGVPDGALADEVDRLRAAAAAPAPSRETLAAAMAAVSAKAAQVASG